MHEIKGYPSFAKIEPITKGWSGDRKYYIETRTGEKLLLRLADFTKHERKQLEFSMMEKVAKLNLPTPKPLDLGTCEGGKSIYSLFTWCEGEDAELVLQNLTSREQYALGVKTGEFLKQIHTIPAPAGQEDWESRFSRKARSKIDAYQACEIKFAGDNHIIGYLEDNWHLLRNRPQSFQHGDYHVGNMVISREKVISVVDFNRYDFGDPWEDFNRIVFSAKTSPYFASGQLNGYFGEQPPDEFFQLLAFYIATNALAALPWAISFGEQEINTMLNQIKDVLHWFDQMKNPIPNWYLGLV